MYAIHPNPSAPLSSSKPMINKPLVREIYNLGQAFFW